MRGMKARSAAAAVSWIGSRSARLRQSPNFALSPTRNTSNIRNPCRYGVVGTAASRVASIATRGTVTSDTDPRWIVVPDSSVFLTISSGCSGLLLQLTGLR
jgi:hypothetical protein